MTTNKKANIQMNDQTILSGLGVCSELDFTLSNFDKKEPCATSTAFSSKLRDEVLRKLCNKKEENTEMLPPQISNKRLTKQNAIENKENQLTSVNRMDKYSSKLTEDFIKKSSNSDSSEQNSLASKDSSLLPGNSFMDGIKLHSLSTENEVDLNKEYQCLHKMPSILLQEASRNDQEPSLLSVWPSSSDYNIEKQKKKTFLIPSSEHLQQDFLDNQKTQKISNNQLTLPSQNAEVEFPSWNSEIKSSFVAFPEGSSCEGEVFESLHLSMFSEAGREALHDKWFEINEKDLEASGKEQDLSGYIDTREVPSSILQWSGLEKDLETEKAKLGIEEIFRAKSCKLGSLTGREKEKPSFGFPPEEVESPPKYDIAGGKAGNSEQLEPKEEHGNTYNPLCRSTMSFSLATEDASASRTSSGDRNDSDSGISDVPKEIGLHQELYKEKLKDLIQKAAVGSFDVEELKKEILSLAHPDVSAATEEHTFDMEDSVDLLELRRYREMLQAKDSRARYSRNTGPIKRQEEDTRNKTPIKRQEEDTRNKTPIKRQEEDARNKTPIKCQEEISRSKKSQKETTSRVKLDPNSKVTRAADGLEDTSSKKALKRNKSREPLKQSSNSKLKRDVVPQPKVSSSSLQRESAPAADTLALSTHCLTAIRTQTDFAAQNPTSNVVLLSLKKIDESFHPYSSEEAQRPLSSFASLTFTPMHYLNPNSETKIDISFSSLLPGRYKAKLQMALFDIALFPHDLHCLLRKEVSFVADVTQPTIEWFDCNISIIPNPGTSRMSMLVGAFICDLLLSFICPFYSSFPSQVHTVCDEKRSLNFGLVPESCMVTKEVVVTNRSKLPLPIVLCLKQILDLSIYSIPLSQFRGGRASTLNKRRTRRNRRGVVLYPPLKTQNVVVEELLSVGHDPPRAAPRLRDALAGRKLSEGGLSSECFDEALCWAPDQSPVKLISNHLAACELAASSSQTVLVNFRAPSSRHLNDSAFAFEMKGALEVLLDSPEKKTQPLLDQIPIEAVIGEVLLTSFRNDIPIILQSEDGQKVTDDFVMLNKSTFSLDLSVQVSGSDSFTVSPSKLSIGSQEKAAIKVGYRPHLDKIEAEIKGDLQIRVEPEGMTLNVPVLGIMPTPPSELSQSFEKTGHSKSQESNESQEKIEKKMELLCSAVRLVFGSVRENEKLSKEISLKNRWTEDTLKVNMLIEGDDAFYFPSETNQKLKFKEIEIGPSQKVSFGVCFEPSKTSLYMGKICLKPRNLARPLRCDIGLYGLGGCGRLTFTHGKTPFEENEEGQVSFGKMIYFNPSFYYVYMKNAGSRSIFVKLRVLPNEASDSAFSISEMSVQPNNFVLGEGESKQIILINSGSPLALRCAPGKVGVLEAVFGDEILRQRLKKVKKGDLNWRNVNDVRLLRMNFEDYLPGEKSLVNESIWSPLPEDSLAFFNNCKIMTIPLYCDVDPTENASCTMLEVEAQHDTMTSFFAPSHAQERVKAQESRPRSPLQDSPSEFHVFPLDLRLKSSQKEPQLLTIYNLSEKDNMFEVEYDEAVLSVDRRAFGIRARGLESIRVLVSTNLSHLNAKALETFIRVFGSNQEKVIRVQVDLDSQDAGADPPGRMLEATTSKGDAFLVPEKPPLKCVKIAKPLAQKGNLEAAPRVDFLLTQVQQERIKKTSIANRTSQNLKIRVEGQLRHFFVKCDTFEIKAKRSVLLPVHFRPKEPGLHRELLVLRQEPSEEETRVELIGRAF